MKSSDLLNSGVLWHTLSSANPLRTYVTYVCRVVEGLLNSLVLLNGIWQMQLFQINQSEDSSKITIMDDNPSGQLHQRSIT